MGWFSGPDVKERNRAGRTEWYGKCEECKKEHFDTDKKKAVRKLENCALVDKTKKRKEADKADRDRREKAAKEEDEKRERDRKAKEKAKRDLAQNARELRRLSKNKKCPFCRKNPCAGTKPKCAAVIASNWEGLGDVSDPATFDEQLRWYKRNME